MGHEDTGNDGFPGKIFKKIPFIVLIILYCIPIIFGLIYISDYAVNVPQADPWGSLVPMTNAFYGGNFNITDLIKTQNDSRPVISNIILVSVSVITHLNMKSIYYVGYFIYIICIIIIFSLIKRDIDLNTKNLILLLPLLYYLLNPFFLGRFINNIGSIFYPVMLLTALIMIFSVYKSKDSGWFFLFSIMMAVACSFSYVAGFAVWIAGFFQLLLQNMRKKYEKMAIWIGSAIITVLTNYIVLGFPETGSHSNSAIYILIKSILQYPVQNFLSYMGSLGAEIIHERQIALFFGLLIFFILIALLINNRHTLEPDKYSIWYGLLTFGLLTSFMVTIARSDPTQTIFYIPAVRHSLAIFLPLVCLYILAIIYSKNSFTNNLSTACNRSGPMNALRKQKYINLFLLLMILAMAFGGFLLHIFPGIRIGQNNFSEKTIDQDILKNYATSSDDKIKRLHPNHPYLVRPQALQLEKNNLSVFYQQDFPLV